MRSHGFSSRGHHPAFTLIEMLVVISIMALLMSMLFPALRTARAAAKTLECSSNMRSVAMDFLLFAEGQSPDGQGDSESLGATRFRAGDFQDHLYGIDEFWDLGEKSIGAVGGAADLMLCPAGGGPLVKRKGAPCGTESIGPAEEVSLALNMRLHRAVVEFKGQRLLAPAVATQVSSRILHHPYVPLVLDVDGAKAVRRGLEPFYTAPAGPAPEGPYAGGRYWVPSGRHQGKTNVAFSGGHVLSSTDPASERWNWGYQAEAGR